MSNLPKIRLRITILVITIVPTESLADSLISHIWSFAARQIIRCICCHFQVVSFNRSEDMLVPCATFNPHTHIIVLSTTTEKLHKKPAYIMKRNWLSLVCVSSIMRKIWRNWQFSCLYQRREEEKMSFYFRSFIRM